MGLLSFKVGNASIKTDWVYVDNLVLALILASMGLLDDIPGRKHPIAAGQAYFISDGNSQHIPMKLLIVFPVFNYAVFSFNSFYR